MAFFVKLSHILAIIWFLSGTTTVLQLKVIDALNTRPPNIIVVLTDDQDIVLNGMTPMQRTQNLLASKGASFINAFTSSPICCPSRASILSGQYAHNHRTYNNTLSGGCYGELWRKDIEGRTLPVHLKANGYNTFYAGKYLNQYRSVEVPPGFTDWYGLHGNSKYYNYTLNENGVLKRFGDQPQEYLTDVLRVRLEKFLSMQVPEQPFFAMIAPPAAHEPFTPAKRHESFFENVTALRTPNFNIESGELDKHWLVRMPPSPLTPDLIKMIDVSYRQRWQTLLAVDELIESMVTQLKRQNFYENTYIVFTSDNGYHLGQFAMPYDKRQPYETDIRVPFIVTGPNVRNKQIVDQPVALIDLMPTILDWAGIEKPEGLDGQSFAGLTKPDANEAEEGVLMLPEENLAEEGETTTEYIDNETTEIAQSIGFERELLVEYWGEGTADTYNSACPWHRSDRLSFCSPMAGCHCQDSWNNTYTCIRHIAHDLDKIYCEFQDRYGFIEAYDLFADPFEMVNLGYDMLPSERAMYSMHLAKLKQCEGDSCHQLD